MSRFLRVFAAVGIVVLPSTSLLAQSTNKPATKEITVCRVALTPTGRQARFHFNYLYSLETTAHGTPPKVVLLDKEKHPPFVREDLIVACLRNWRLEPSGKYSVIFSVGTTGDPNSISIIEPGSSSTIRLVLPRERRSRLAEVSSLRLCENANLKSFPAKAQRRRVRSKDSGGSLMTVGPNGFDLWPMPAHNCD